MPDTGPIPQKNDPHNVDLPAAARYLELEDTAVRALVALGYLRPLDRLGDDEADARFALADLKAFVARNADNGSGNLAALLADRSAGTALDDGRDDASPETTESRGANTQPASASSVEGLLAALDGRCAWMARRAYEIFSTVFPETSDWSLAEQAKFIDQARNRFEAILAVTGQGSEVDEALVGDLQDVGAAAAWAGSPLPHLLAILRISRDLVVQTAVEIAEERGRHWVLALSLLLTRVLPAMDRLTDALAQGYWAAVVGKEEELRDRYQHVVETSSNGVFEVDLDGRIQYANPSLGVILGRRPEDLDDVPLRDVVVPSDPTVSVEPLMSDQAGAQTQLTVLRADGAQRMLEVRTTARYRFDELVGYQGVVRDVTSEHELEANRNEFIALVTRDLRAPLVSLLAQGANLEAHAAELPPAQVARMGRAIRHQAERTARLADDLYDVSRLEAAQLILSPRPVDLAGVVHSALASVPDSGVLEDDGLSSEAPDGLSEGSATQRVEIRIPFGVEVMADARRLEQIVANLVENGLSHGVPPVVVSLEGAANGTVEVAITDQGPGVDPRLVATLFSGLRTLTRPDHDAARGTGLGLALVKSLVEGMGGTVAYERVAERGARFVVTLPQPRRS